MLGLLLNANRVETRRSYGTLKAIQGAFASTVGIEYFRALYDDPDEAEARFMMHKTQAEAAAAANETPTDNG